MMVEIYNNLFIGNQMDFEMSVKQQSGWVVVHACKEPYHRQALGYSGRGCPKAHPEYLYALRGNRLILNLVDVEDPSWISPVIIDEAMSFLDTGLSKGYKALVHCNQGASRSAGIGLLYLAHIGQFTGMDFYAAEAKYKALYPPYQPAGGMRGFCVQNWAKHRKATENL